MTEKIKFIITIGLVGILATSVFINYQTFNAKKAIERERDQLKNENDTLAMKIEEVTRERKQLQDKIGALNNDLNNVSQEKEDIQKRYELIVKERSELTEKLWAVQSDNKRLYEDLSGLTQEKQELEQKFDEGLAPLKKDNVILKRQLKSLVERKINLEKRLNELSNLSKATESAGSPTETDESKKEFIELPPIVVRSQTTAPAPEKKSAKDNSKGAILDINKENNFVVIDLGQNSGIKVGETLSVYRKDIDKAIAAIEVIQVRNTIAACDIKKEAAPIQIGDTVR